MSTQSPLIQKARALQESGTSVPSVFTTEVEIVTAAQVDTAELAGLAQAITRSREIIHKHEAACHETTLEHYLDAGQMLARAQEIFTLSPQDRTSPATLSRRDNVEEVPPEIAAIRGFSAWLAAELPTLKRPTAIKYATAYRSLDLPLTAQPAEIRSALKTLRHEAGKAGAPMPTLATLVKTAPKQPKLEVLAISRPNDSKQLRLEDARESLQNWKDAWEKIVKSGQLDDLTPRDVQHLKDFQLRVGDQIKARLK